MGRFGAAMLGILLLGSRSAHADGAVLMLPPEDQQEITARLGPGGVGKALPGMPIQDPSVYFSLDEKDRRTAKPASCSGA